MNGAQGTQPEPDVMSSQDAEWLESEPARVPSAPWRVTI